MNNMGTKKDNTIRTKKDLNIIFAFTYKGITGLDFLTVEIYDKKTKKMFIGSIEKSSWTLKDIKKQHKLTKNKKR